MLTINVIGKSNDVGLSRDLDLLTQALLALGCEVVVTAVDDVSARRRRSRLAQWVTRWKLFSARTGLGRSIAPVFDVNLMLEHLWPQYLGQARFNIAIPNPEWFDRHDERFLDTVDRVWAKTVYTLGIFHKLSRPATLIGFDSHDRYDPSVERSRTFFHLAGKSVLKGTRRLLELWTQHPEWPKLVIVQHSRRRELQHIDADNIEHHLGYLSDRQLRYLQNASAFHLCLSETEGWGHYIVEALSVGAVTITVDAPPMNELVTAERGLMVPYSATASQRLAQTYLFDSKALEITVQRAVAMQQTEVTMKGEAARRWFVENKQSFVGRLQQALTELSAT